MLGSSAQRATAVALVSGAALLLAPSLRAQPAPPPIWPDTFLNRLEALAVMETLNATLLGARSATFTLDAWCADHKLAADGKIHARLMRGVDKPASAEQRQRLEVGADELVKFRHVELTCGEHILSEADNWYVPARLTAEMNHLLDATDTPFGRAVAPLKPFRRTFAVEVHWKPLDDGWEVKPPPADHPNEALDIPAKLLEHRALLFTPDLKPIAEVDENYTRENLAFAPPR
jgi:hypothetical protein